MPDQDADREDLWVYQWLLERLEAYVKARKGGEGKNA